MIEGVAREDISMAIDTTVGRVEGTLRFRGWESAVAAEQWDRAFARLRGLVDLYAPTASPDLWKRLLLAGIDAAAHANARGEVGRFVRQAGAYSGRPTMRELAPSLEVCRRNKNDALAEEIGGALVHVWPDDPIGWFVRAEAAERRGVRRGWRPRDKWANDFAAAYDRRAGLSPGWCNRVCLRFVVAALRAGAAHADIRDALKQVDREQLTSSELDWLAYGLAHSRHWIDQVKAVDLVDQRLDEADRFSRPPADDALETIERLFERLDPEPRDTVIARLEDLLAHRSLPDGRVAQWRQIVETRRQLASQMQQPLLEATELSGSAAVLAEAHRGVVPVGDELLAHVARLIDAPTIDRLNELRRDLVRFPDDAWRPIAVLWPRLLNEPDASLSTAIDRLGRAWSERAPAPSYGWWRLAESFLSADAFEAAQAAAWRGLAEEKDDRADGARDVVLGKVTTKLVREADLKTLRDWLEAARPD